MALDWTSFAGPEPKLFFRVAYGRVGDGFEMTNYDIKLVEPRNQKAVGRKDAATRERKLDWERAMREAAQAEQLVKSAD